ncbi:MAG: DUF4351 domain-containing protein [Oleiphilaceae bacterium]|nr:DUF4351 domain-containing protein [Oleiphilaceae bacterium]
MTSHDQNFKNLILDYPRQALAFFAESEARDLDDSVVIKPIRQEQLKNRLGDRFRELDIPLLVEWPDGRREALLFVIEEETRPGRFSIHRLVHYCADLSELYQTDRMVPVVIFLRGSTAAPKELNLGTERCTYLSFQYLYTELASMPAAQYWDGDNLVARLNLPNMQWPPDRKVDAYAQATRGLIQLEPDVERQLKYIDFIDIYSALDDNAMRTYQERYPQETQTMIGLRERLLAEGEQRGEQKGEKRGEKRGEQKGVRKTLIKLLTRRFGPLDNDTSERIQQASPEEVELWLERILDARSLEDVFSSW